MTKQELMALLRDPDQTGQSVDELNRLIEENPYFHTGHQLYLKGLQQTNEKQMAIQLGKAALSVRDRGVLYNYLNRPSLPSISTDCMEIQVPFVPGNTFVSREADIHKIQQTCPGSEPASPEQNKWGDWKNTEELITAEEKIMSSQQLMDIVRRQLEQIDSPQKESQPQPEAVADTVEKATDAIETTGNVVEVLPEPTENDVEIRAEYSEEQLLADLIKIAPLRTGVAKKPPHDSAVIEKTSDDAITKEKRELTPYNLVDSFLKSNPKIIPDENRTYQVDLTESLRENQDIATETLADIYAMQGHKNKAIEIYEHLILKYPEKHIYFAAQIDRLKEQNKSMYLCIH